MRNISGSTKTQPKRNIASYVITAALAAVIGVSIGNWQAQGDTIKEVETWHTAHFEEDGSWRVTYKDGNIVHGCVQNALCQD